MDSGNLISFLKSLSILLPLAIALIRLPKMQPDFYPFVCYLLAGVVAEVISFYVITVARSHNAMVQNVYVLFEWFVISWQFWKWNFFKSSKQYFASVVLCGLLIWVAENFLFGSIFLFGPYFRWLSSFVIVIMSVNTINYIITHEFGKLYMNARFIICLSFIIFFSYKIVYEWAYQVFNINQNIAFSNMVINFFGYLNAVVNILYVAAALAIPQRQKIL